MNLTNNVKEDSFAVVIDKDKVYVAPILKIHAGERISIVGIDGYFNDDGVHNENSDVHVMTLKDFFNSYKLPVLKVGSVVEFVNVESYTHTRCEIKRFPEESDVQCYGDSIHYLVEGERVCFWMTIEGIGHTGYPRYAMLPNGTDLSEYMNVETPYSKEPIEEGIYEVTKAGGKTLIEVIFKEGVPYITMGLHTFAIESFVPIGWKKVKANA